MADNGAKKISAALTVAALDAASIEAFVRDPSAGAVASFIGTARNVHQGRSVLGLEYEAHPSLALKLIEQICGEAVARFGLAKAALHHRLGRLEIGEASVVIAVSSAHRAAAFDGCRYIIEELKTRVPIWKKEHYADGSAPQWVGPDGKQVGV